MRKILLAILLALLAPAAWAQFTTVTGTVTDPNGIPYSGGTITAQLITAGVTPTINGGSFAATGSAGLDTTGSFTMRLADNSVMVPNTLKWSFTVCSAKGTVNPAFGTASQCFTPAPITISGASQSITSQLTAAALALTVPFSAGACPTCITGSGTTNTFPLFTAPKVIGNSGLSEPSGAGNGLQYAGSSFTFAGSGALITSSTPGVQIFVTTPNATGATQAGGFSFLGGESTGTGAGNGLFLEAPGANSGTGGPALFEAGFSISGTGGATTVTSGSSTTGQGGNLYLNAGPNLTGTNGKNGAIIMDTAQDGLMQPLYLPNVVFADLAVPLSNPFSFPSAFNTNGAFEWCSDCTGAADAASQGAVTGNSGHGALVYYDANTPAWRVVSGINFSATSQTISAPLACVAASGSGTTYTCTTSPAFLPGVGNIIQLQVDVANTGAATLNVNAHGAKAMTKQGGTNTALVANDLVAGQDTIFVYDGTNWQMQGQLGNAASGGLPTGLTFVSPTFTISSATNGNGVLGLAGNTSGVATITAPAVAGTSGNPFVFSNAIQVPTGGAGIVQSSSAGLFSIASAAQILAACTGCAPVASPTFTGTVTYPLVATTTNCSAAGSAANPSIAACTAAPSGAFSCATNASTGTCQVTSTAVTANSNVWVQPTGATAVGTRLSVTCNTTADTGLVAPRVSAIASGSFTINLGTFSTNPECFLFGVTD